MNIAMLTGLHRSMIARKSVTLLTGTAAGLLLAAYLPKEAVDAMRNETVTTLLLLVAGGGGAASVRLSKENEKELNGE